MWHCAQALLLLLLLARSVGHRSAQKAWGGGGALTADVLICAVEPEENTGEYCNSWYKRCTLTLKLKNLYNLNEV